MRRSACSIRRVTSSRAPARAAPSRCRRARSHCRRSRALVGDRQLTSRRRDPVLHDRHRGAWSVTGRRRHGSRAGTAGSADSDLRRRCPRCAHARAHRGDRGHRRRASSAAAELAGRQPLGQGDMPGPPPLGEGAARVDRVASAASTACLQPRAAPATAPPAARARTASGRRPRNRPASPRSAAPPTAASPAVGRDSESASASGDVRAVAWSRCAAPGSAVRRSAARPTGRGRRRPIASSGSSSTECTRPFQSSSRAPPNRPGSADRRSAPQRVGACQRSIPRPDPRWRVDHGARPTRNSTRHGRRRARARRAAARGRTTPADGDPRARNLRMSPSAPRARPQLKRARQRVQHGDHHDLPVDDPRAGDRRGLGRPRLAHRAVLERAAAPVPRPACCRRCSGRRCDGCAAACRPRWRRCSGCSGCVVVVGGIIAVHRPAGRLPGAGPGRPGDRGARRPCRAGSRARRSISGRTRSAG